MNAWLIGKPGTGKTLVAKFVLRKLSKDGKISGAYVNCWEHNSFYAVLDKLISDLRIFGAEKLSTPYKLERLRHSIGTKPFVLILDEIDHPTRNDRDSIIYNLSSIGNVCLVLISHSAIIFFSMDDRIKSRLNAKRIDFPPYSDEDLAEILRLRAEFALLARTWELTLLKKIATLAKGDARCALQLLKNAALRADMDECDCVREIHVQETHSASASDKKTWLLEKLSSHHRLLLDIVKERGEINSGELWEAYLDRCRAENRPAIALRTFSEYMNKLIELGLVRWDRALVRGKVRVFSAV
jgi:Cdc6-like AAA superfamily ATPase